MAKSIGYKLTPETSKTYESCAAGKAKQKNVTNSSDHVSAKENCVGLFLGVSTIKSPKYIKVSVTKLHWRIMMDERIGLKLSDLFQANNGMIFQPVCSSENAGKEDSR